MRYRRYRRFWQFEGKTRQSNGHNRGSRMNANPYPAWLDRETVTGVTGRYPPPLYIPPPIPVTR